eukprot:GHVQ01015039.1.p1 GENE.GHVQ01015039.1~~GHVQ01015039.1.p1  ORF type:complete len:266 (+),score=45.03 GHVQ01015039.1:145-942(+)
MSSYRSGDRDYGRDRGGDYGRDRDGGKDRDYGRDRDYRGGGGGGGRDHDRGRDGDRGDPRDYRRMLERKSRSSIYVGNLSDSVREEELDDIFYKYGRILDIDIKRGRSGNGKAYAFLEFESTRDAEDAVDRCDGRPYGDSGNRLRVELTGDRRPKNRDTFAPRGGGGGSGSFRRTTGAPTRTGFRVLVTNLPQGCRWQHLKDHMRKAGDVGFANVEPGIRGEEERGVVEYTTSEDMKYAVEKLDGTELEAAYNVSTIKVSLVVCI